MDVWIGGKPLMAPLCLAVALTLPSEILKATQSVPSADGGLVVRDSTELYATQRLTVWSPVMEEERAIHLDVTSDAETASGTYDMIIVLDAETQYRHVLGSLDVLTHRFVGAARPAVVVGLPNTDRLRDVTPTSTERFPGAGGVTRFLAFLFEEVIPFVETRYRVTGTRVLIGHSGSGLAAMYAAIFRPDDLSGVIAVDPSIDWDDNVFFEDLNRTLRRGGRLPEFLVFPSYREKETTAALIDRLAPHRGVTSHWETRIYQGETHNSMVVPAVFDALRAFYVFLEERE